MNITVQKMESDNTVDWEYVKDHKGVYITDRGRYLVNTGTDVIFMWENRIEPAEECWHKGHRFTKTSLNVTVTFS